jgi:hypothetical protein
MSTNPHSGSLRDGMAAEVVRSEFAPLVDYFSQRFWFQGDINQFDLRRIRSDIPRRLEQLITESATWDTPVTTVDLHSAGSARRAREILDSVWSDGITVVSYGKGKQVLHAIFLDVLGRQHTQKLLGRGGETPQRPLTSTGVALHHAIEEKWELALEALAEQREREASERSRSLIGRLRGSEASDEASFFDRVLRLIKS